MTSTERLLKTQQVAQMLGVSGATVKRWVDAGTIDAARTLGKHRLIALSEVKRIAREIGVKPAALELDLEASGSGEAADKGERVRDSLTAFLKEGRTNEARNLIRLAWRSDFKGADLADQLIAPVMERIGHGWMVGQLDVFQEHLASSIVATEIQERVAEVSFGQPKSDLLAIGATIESDFYVLPCLLAELLLREMGWDVRNLGTNLPLSSLARATRLYQPRMVFLSFNYLKDEEQFVREYHAFHAVAREVNAAVILGGRALRPDLRARLPYTAFGDRMSHLVEFAKQLDPQTTKPALPRPESNSDRDKPFRSNKGHE